MKSAIRFFVIAAIITAVLPMSSCKKGPDDPAISFRSRTSRLAGTWNLSAADYTETTTVTNGNTKNITSNHYVFDGTKMTITTTETIGNSSPKVDTAVITWTESYVFEKANTFTSETTRSYFGMKISLKSTGSWSWLHKDKDADLKNKEAVVVMPVTYSGVNGGSNGKLDVPEIWQLQELRNTKMVVTMNNSSDDGLGKNNGTVTATTGTKTYAQ